MLITPSRRGRLKLFKHRAGALDLPQAHQQPRKRIAWALIVLEREPEAALDLNPPLKQSGRDFARVRLRQADARDHRRHDPSVTSPFSFPQRTPRVGQRRGDVRMPQVKTDAEAEDPRLP